MYDEHYDEGECRVSVKINIYMTSSHTNNHDHRAASSYMNRKKWNKVVGEEWGIKRRKGSFKNIVGKTLKLLKRKKKRNERAKVELFLYFWSSIFRLSDFSNSKRNNWGNKTDIDRLLNYFFSSISSTIRVIHSP